MTTIQIYALWHRIKQINRSFAKSIKKGKLVLLDNSDWEKVKIETFTNCGHGLTYLDLYLSDDSLLKRIELIGG